MILSGCVFVYRVHLISIVPSACLLFTADNTKEAEPFIKYFQYQKLLNKIYESCRDLYLCNPPVSCMTGHFVLGN
jgi:hypothetical protein